MGKCFVFIPYLSSENHKHFMSIKNTWCSRRQDYKLHHLIIKWSTGQLKRLARERDGNIACNVPFNSLYCPSFSHLFGCQKPQSTWPNTNWNPTQTQTKTKLSFEKLWYSLILYFFSIFFPGWDGYRSVNTLRRWLISQLFLAACSRNCRGMWKWKEYKSKSTKYTESNMIGA